MIICGIDCETTGLDAEKDHITELAWVVMDTEKPEKPLLLKHYYLQLPEGVVVPENITKFTKITDALLSTYGTHAEEVAQTLLNDLYFLKVEALVAQNAPFDRGFLRQLMKRSNLGDFEFANWIDTKRDVLYPEHIRSRGLVALCAEHGFLNPFPHSALFDVMAMLRVLSFYPIHEVIAYRDEPMVYLAAGVNFDTREMAKGRGFRWQEWDGKEFPKTWVKGMKSRFVEAEINAAKDAGFEVTRIQENAHV